MADGLKPMYGGLLKAPMPLELSGNFCSHKCVYCYANLNVPNRNMDVKSVINLLANYQSRNTIEARLLQNKYLILISNHIDPFSASNYRQMIPIMQMMTDLGLEYTIATKGGKGWEQVLEFMPKGVWYISISHTEESTRLHVEPASPSLDHRYELIGALKEKGHTVLVGCNPCEYDWLLEPEKYFDNLKNIGVHGVWLENLHINTKQRSAMPKRDLESISDLVYDCTRRKKNPDRYQFLLDCRNYAMSIGLHVNSVGQPNYSEYFEPYRALYTNVYPTTQDFINSCVKQDKEFITYREWVDFYTPLFPSFVTSQNYHYIESNVRRAPDENLGFKPPKNPSFESILKCAIKSKVLPASPTHSLGFSFAVDKDENNYLDNDGCPILCFNENGWTHEMIIYDNHPL